MKPALALRHTLILLEVSNLLSRLELNQVVGLLQRVLLRAEVEAESRTTFRKYGVAIALHGASQEDLRQTADELAKTLSRARFCLDNLSILQDEYVSEIARHVEKSWNYSVDIVVEVLSSFISGLEQIEALLEYDSIDIDSILPVSDDVISQATKLAGYIDRFQGWSDGVRRIAFTSEVPESTDRLNVAFPDASRSVKSVIHHLEAIETLYEIAAILEGEGYDPERFVVSTLVGGSIEIKLIGLDNIVKTVAQFLVRRQALKNRDLEFALNLEIQINQAVAEGKLSKQSAESYVEKLRQNIGVYNEPKIVNGEIIEPVELVHTISKEGGASLSDSPIPERDKGQPGKTLGGNI